MAKFETLFEKPKGRSRDFVTPSAGDPETNPSGSARVYWHSAGRSRSKIPNVARVSSIIIDGYVWTRCRNVDVDSAENGFIRASAMTSSPLFEGVRESLRRFSKCMSN